jgi:5'-3' exonuclease
MRIAYEELFTNALISGIVGHPRLEADDCIALWVRRNATLEQPKEILILTSDYDYLQLLSANVAIVDLLNKNLAASKKCFGDPELDLFCKIVAGDKSDNIKQVFPRVGPKTALKLFNSEGAMETLFAKHPGSRSRFEHNQTMIDFRFIPSDIASQFLEANILP